MLDFLKQKDITEVGGWLKNLNLAAGAIFGFIALIGIAITLISGFELSNVVMTIIFFIPFLAFIYNYSILKNVEEELHTFKKYYCMYCDDDFIAKKPRSKNKDDVYCPRCGTRINTRKEFINGRIFENYVENRFQDGFDILHKTPRFEDKVIHASKYPDLLVKSTRTNNKDIFFVEAKYRSKTDGKKLEIISNPFQLRRFRRLEKDTGYKIFFYIGYGGKPDKPAKIYVVPLKDIKDVEIDKSILNSYKGNKNAAFYNEDKKKLY